MFNKLKLESTAKRNKLERSAKDRLAQTASVSKLQTLNNGEGGEDDQAQQQVLDTRKLLRTLFDSYALMNNRMTVDTI